MAKQLDDLVEEALGGVGSAVPGAHACVRSGWLELTASLPEWALSDYDDFLGLQVGSQLRGSSRLARHFGECDPHLRADACIEHVPDVREWLSAACMEMTDSLRLFAESRDALPPPVVPHAPPASLADVAHACAEAGWRAVAGDDGSRLHVDIPTRSGAFAARLESSPNAGERFVVELTDLAGQPQVCRRATAALLLAVSASVRSVKGGLVERDGATIAVLVSALEGALDRSVDHALSALAVACQLAGREAQALMDERLASEYLALSRGAPQGKSHSSMEVETCLQ
jgi:hypothetical protein